jgi:hypothetical protein
MAVEFRCPECRTKLRLASAPDPGEEVECPKCAHVFPAPDLAEAGYKPKKKSAPAGDEDRPKKSAEDGAAGEKPPEKAADKKKLPKRKKAKKKKSNPLVLVGVVLGALAFLGVMVGALVWFLGRKSAAVEMMSYLPEDTTEAVGLNINHLQKYPEFYKQVEPLYANTSFKRTADTLARALGTDVNDLVDYAVMGFGRSGSAIVLRTKKEFDTEGLKKLPGAKEQTADGLRYYRITDISGTGFSGTRAFAPTNRLVVFCPGTIPDGTFRNMLKGNKDNADKALVGRMGPLGTRVSKGTWWLFRVGDRLIPPRPAPAAAAPDGGFGTGTNEEAQLAEMMAKEATSAKGVGFKASVGSREIRFEVVVWYPDGEKASSTAKKWKESELAKGDEGEPPRWWKSVTSKVGGDKKIQIQLLSNIGFTSSGELFVARTAVDTVVLGNSAGGIVNALTGQQAADPSAGGGQGPGPPGGAPPPPGVPSGPQGPPPGRGGPGPP